MQSIRQIVTLLYNKLYENFRGGNYPSQNQIQELLDLFKNLYKNKKDYWITNIFLLTDAPNSSFRGRPRNYVLFLRYILDRNSREIIENLTEADIADTSARTSIFSNQLGIVDSRPSTEECLFYIDSCL